MPVPQLSFSYADGKRKLFFQRRADTVGLRYDLIGTVILIWCQTSA